MDSVMTTTRPRRAPVDTRATYDRFFYSGMAIVMAVTVLVGFGPTYYLRAYFGTPATVTGSTELSALAHVHGALFTAWVLLFVVQTALVSRRELKLHRSLGVLGVALAALMCVIGVRTALAAAQRGAAPPGVDALTFLVVPLFDIVLFAGFVTAAVFLRRNKEAHKRLMLLAYVSIIVAAVARLPGVLQYGPPVFFGLAFVFVLIGAAYDLASRGRIHRVYLWGGALFALSVPARLMLSQTAAWQSVAEFLVR